MAAAATPVAVAALTNDTYGLAVDLDPLRLAQPDQLVASSAKIDAVPLTNNSIALDWLPRPNTKQYRIYSDMGSGYGVYIYKAQTVEPTYIDEHLRPGMSYNYRITRLETGPEMVLAQVNVATFGSKQALITTLASQRLAASVVVTPTVAPTPLPPDAVLLGLLSENNFTDGFNTLTIAGEVRNDSALDVGQTNIAVTFYDTNGTVIDRATGETLLDVLPPGVISPFIITLSRPAGMASYSLRAVARPVEPVLTKQLSIIEQRRFEDEAGFLHIKGIVKNVGTSVSKRTKVAAVIYGRDGRVINVGFTYVQPPTIAPGEEATYDVSFTYYPRFYTQTVIPFEE